MGRYSSMKRMVNKMIIDRLTINNFKNYVDENIFDWSMSPNKNVILIGGMNGSGKTTISEAIRLCLYGRKMNGPPMSDSKYNTYLNDIWSKNRRNEKMFISIDVVLDAEEPPIRMTITRTFSFYRGKITESLSLTKNDKDVELIDKSYWEYYVSKILPPHLSRYFFFDGEKIRDTISSDSSSDYLFEAIKDLTGVSKLELLKTDLSEVRKRVSRTDIKPGVSKKIKSMESRIESLQSEISTLNDSLDLSKSKRESLLERKSQLDDEFNRAIGAKEKMLSDLKNEISLKKTNYSELNEYIQEFIYSSYPKMICDEITDLTLSAAKAENDNNLAYVNGDYLKDRIIKFKEAINKLSLDTDVMNSVLGVVDTQFSDVDKKLDFETPIIDLTYNQIDVIRSNKITDEEKVIFINRLREREDLNIQIAKLEKELSQFSDESVSEFENQLSIVKKEIEDNDKLNLEINALIKSKTEEIATLKKSIYEEEKSLILSTRDSMAISVIEDTVKNIDIRISLQLADCVQELEYDINHMYDLLKNKKDMVKHISILPDYSLKLSGFDDSTVSVEHISEGEKGILMYSVMYGLLNISNSKLPLIIDSPLGRMDSEHVDHLIKYLYPIFGNQVIILSHDREITVSTLPQLESVLSKTFILKNQYPKVNLGYFE